MDDIYARMQDDIELQHRAPDKGESEIQKYFVGKTVFLSGCTGFVGKCILEKLLRSCKGVKTIYTLLRTKRNQPIEERMNQLLQHVLFTKAIEQDPDCVKKIVPLQGDLKKPGIGMSPEDRRLLTESVDIIIHNGAVVYFDANITLALKVNVLGTKQLIDLADECANLEVFLYISTAYSHCYLKYIEEKFYPPPGDLKMVDDIIAADAVNGITQESLDGILGQWPNVYTFSKSISEGLVQKHSRVARYTCGVYRPAIVSSTYKEPLISWCGNANGPVAPFIGISLGIVHSVRMDRNPCMDLVPADMTANAALAIIWDLAKNKQPKQEHLYNYASSDTNPVTICYMRDVIFEHSFDFPSTKMVWDFFIFLPQSYIVSYVLHILLHFIPVLLYDLFLLLTLQKPKATSIFLKLHHHLPKLDQFLNGNWKITMKEVFNLCDRMGPADREIFNIDLRTISWEEYMYSYWRGLRAYVIEDPIETAPDALKRYRKLHIMHRSILTVLVLCIMYCINSKLA